MKLYSTITIILLFALQTFVASAKPKQLTPTITWELQKDGTLMITGTGDMPDLEKKENPEKNQEDCNRGRDNFYRRL